MTFDLVITFGNLLTLGTIFFAATGAWFILKGKVDKNAEELKETKEQAQDSLQSSVALQNRLSQLELQMLREFVSTASMRELESRITTSISDMRNELSKLTAYLMDRKN